MESGTAGDNSMQTQSSAPVNTHLHPAETTRPKPPKRPKTKRSTPPNPHLINCPTKSQYDGGKNGVHFSYPISSSLPADIRQKMLAFDGNRDLSKPPVVYGSNMENKLTQAEYDALPSTKKIHYDLCIAPSHPKPRSVVSIIRKELEGVCIEQWGIHFGEYSSLSNHPPFERAKILFSTETRMADKYGFPPEVTRPQVEQYIVVRYRAEQKKKATLNLNSELNKLATSDMVEEEEDETVMSEADNITNINTNTQPPAMEPDDMDVDPVETPKTAPVVVVQCESPPKRPRLAPQPIRSPPKVQKNEGLAPPPIPLGRSGSSLLKFEAQFGTGPIQTFKKYKGFSRTSLICGFAEDVEPDWVILCRFKNDPKQKIFTLSDSNFDKLVDRAITTADTLMCFCPDQESDSDEGDFNNNNSAHDAEALPVLETEAMSTPAPASTPAPETVISPVTAPAPQFRPIESPSTTPPQSPSQLQLLDSLDQVGDGSSFTHTEESDYVAIKQEKFGPESQKASTTSQQAIHPGASITNLLPHSTQAPTPATKSTSGKKRKAQTRNSLTDGLIDPMAAVESNPDQPGTRKKRAAATRKKTTPLPQKVVIDQEIAASRAEKTKATRGKVNAMMESRTILLKKGKAGSTSVANE